MQMWGGAGRGSGPGRRAFLEEGVRLAALALLAGACRDGSITGAELAVEVAVQLGAYPALAVQGGVARIAGVSPPLAVVHLGPGAYAALSLVCPHQGGRVDWTGAEFVCAEHGARFGVGGTWQGGRRTSGLRTWRTEYDAATDTLTIFPSA
ncbi:MAG: Rieske (2Fe-2S) protein [Gemmatimonadetes bacterium]|nr:Rieske (2Fe-2S) protein [Gemmatimonadota bacterium]